MADNYMPLLKQLDNCATSKGANFTQQTAEQASIAIRALVEENERLELALKAIVELPISDGSQDDMPAASMRCIARAALGETK
jgi:hypothetical protein